MSYFVCGQVLEEPEEIDNLIENKTSSQREHQDIMEQASNDSFSKNYKKYKLHDKEKLGKLCTFFLSVLLLCSVLLLVYFDFATLYCYFALCYYLELKSSKIQ